jgi:hypothetical protein
MKSEDGYTDESFSVKLADPPSSSPSRIKIKMIAIDTSFGFPGPCDQDGHRVLLFLLPYN